MFNQLNANKNKYIFKNLKFGGKPNLYIYFMFNR